MIILASKSPRRNQLMKMVGLEFECIPSDAEEVIPEGLGSEKIAEYLSSLKAEDVFSSHPKGTVIGSDTVVYIDGEILGKPKDKNEAFEMLKKLSGRRHTVFTGVTIINARGKRSFTSATDVYFYPLSDKEIWDYIETGEPMDKAGAYGIQGIGAVLIEKISGDYFTVMGFPVAMVVRNLREMTDEA